MTGVRTPIPPLVCEFIMTLSFRLSTKKKKMPKLPVKKVDNLPTNKK